jgi:hypothetical protein
MCGCEKGKDESNSGNKGNNKEICKIQKFTLILTLKFQSGKTEKLKRDFNSRPDVEGCNYAKEKDFKRVYKKLIQDYKNSQKKNTDKSKAVDKITSVSTQVVSSSDGCNACKNCLLSGYPFCVCGCKTPSNQNCTSCFN